MTMRERLHRRNRRDDRKEIRRRLALAKKLREGKVVTLATLERESAA